MGVETDGPSAKIRFPCTTTVESGFGEAPVASMTVTWAIAIVSSRVDEQQANTAALNIVQKSATVARVREERTLHSSVQSGVATIY